ncbi:GlxA family transcriptional regulator [Arthrobacter antibioticus]|uniref:GlxA family transcriptional regulator n=1 Tax=Arthrobacter sp. H35-MC1 TaxID=3046203 RepID=UPI0024BAA4E8|nr:DJ-1/PfpI family protein [Arthrobacter sp. H35-MC1]MDJ0318698.1 DJ-1/PfpI family protein [Arthrobacter sp. H35-MC1]
MLRGRAISVGMVAFDGAQLLDITGPLEVFNQANRLGVANYHLQIIGWRDLKVITSSGVQLVADILATDCAPVDLLIVSGADDLSQLPTGPSSREQLERLMHHSSRVASICTGAFILASAGLLDGRQATTHWKHADALAGRFPRVQVDPDSIFVRSGRFITSAGVTSGIDLALALVEEDHGPDLARDIARELVVFLRRPGGQSQFSIRQRTPVTMDMRLHKLMDAITNDPAETHTVESMASTVAMSSRHLRRLFHREIGITPGGFISKTRLEAARMLLEQGLNVTQAATRAGFANDEALRRAFKGTYDTLPTTYQDCFRTTQAEPVD